MRRYFELGTPRQNGEAKRTWSFGLISTRMIIEMTPAPAAPLRTLTLRYHNLRH